MSKQIIKVTTSEYSMIEVIRQDMVKRNRKFKKS